MGKMEMHIQCACGIPLHQPIAPANLAAFPHTSCALAVAGISHALSPLASHSSTVGSTPYALLGPGAFRAVFCLYIHL